MNLTDRFPPTLREINSLPEPERRGIYSTLTPTDLLEQLGMSGVGESDLIADGRLQFRAPSGSRSLEITLKRHPKDVDPLLYFHMADTFNYQLLVLLVVANDLDQPRFHTDVDQDGNRTRFGTESRNLPAETAAMLDGLAPGQVRRGLRVFRTLVPNFERFVARMEHDIFFIEPLAYHNAIIFERYGFSYVRGLQEMHTIHKAFQPGGEYYQRLHQENPFRTPQAAETIRGRSWAIHDGILGHPFTGFQMYKRINHHANVVTAPNIPF
ncbi:MAG: hypothetical protein ACOYL5_10685 [Phototrophicaceae bacterium]|jgi:hypothetical protein